MGAVGAVGTYTIVEEAEDADGNLWGKLKSGIGWINLQEANTTSDAPIAAIPAEERLLNGLQYHEYIRDSSEHTVKLLFLPSETLKDVRFTSLQYENGSMAVAEELYSLPELSPDMPLVVGVLFYGDLTTYGISFTDTNGVQRYFSVYISGRNGALEMVEYTP